MEVTQVAFILFPKVHLQDLAGPAQVFFEAAELGNRKFKTVYAEGRDARPGFLK
ncbi:MAG TPA: hypothetical protein PKE06_06815 [Flavilitoribacter sp.]|nr:hypothetical protein [Flavilitoribacter sp.]HMQ89518.1 hypothetical protein [Flavilitoribacter sp.]